MFNLVESELKKREKFSKTENGAVGYKSSGSALVDLNFAVSSLRSADEKEIKLMFDQAFYEDPEYTLKWLFFARDIRAGLGERRLFRICYRELWKIHPQAFTKNLKHISEFGRWDDLISLIGLNEEVDLYIINEFIKPQLDQDLKGIETNKPISLLGKWMPSENTSSKTTKTSAKKVRSLLDISSKDYRRMLSKLRKHLNVVEIKMCNQEWNAIDYETVPSLANLKYKNAFIKHDEVRRRQYLMSVEKGSAKMNMSVATPVDIVAKYSPTLLKPNAPILLKPNEYDETLELAWKNLKDVSISETMVVADGSGSMLSRVSGSSKITALNVANALAIYAAEHNKGVYKDKYVTFSHTPQFVDLTPGKTLRDRLRIALGYDECSNTNIEAVFDLILDLAIKNDVPKDEMIKNVLIISDMEFDSAQNGWRHNDTLTETLFEGIKRRYEDAGYHLPKLIFWNVISRTKVIPLEENEMGVGLVSGFSQNVLKMVMSNQYDPYEILKETLDQKRYEYIVL